VAAETPRSSAKTTRIRARLRRRATKPGTKIDGTTRTNVVESESPRVKKDPRREED
jgi:hypothetical protein